jgi:cytochrome c553
MNYLLAYLAKDYLKQIAEYFAAQRPPLPPPMIPDVSNALLARGEAIVTHGDAAADIPACSSCHGPHLTAWSRPFQACWACARPTSARSSARDAMAPEPQLRPTVCRSSRVT